MSFRTDLAIETQEMVSEKISGVEHIEKKYGNVKVTDIKIKGKEASNKLNKPPGDYITIEFENLANVIDYTDVKIDILSKEVKKLVPKNGLVLIIGIGNTNITPDALGPKSISYILSTRHIKGDVLKSTGLKNLRPVAAAAPGVLGQTGIETNEFILSLVEKIKPTCVILIDALASKNAKHLGSTIQLSNTGISPGSGVGNSRPAINESTLKVPVISIGVPTVVDASTLAYSLVNCDEIPKEAQEILYTNNESMMVTPREIDLLIDRASKLIGFGINFALQENFSKKDIFFLTCQ